MSEPAQPRTVTEDTLLDGRVRLKQPGEGYRAAIDPVFLAAAVPAVFGQSVLDLGCGAGAASLCLMARIPNLQVVGLEVQQPLVRLAAENAEINGRRGRFSPMIGNLLRPPPRLAPGSFHHVMANPPYLVEARHSMAPGASKRTADSEGEARLEDWLRVAFTMVRAKGSVTLIQRADRLGEVMAALPRQAGAVAVFPLWPGIGKPAKRVLIRARKEVASPMALLPGLVLHGEDGRYTRAAEAILRDGRALDF